MASAFEPAHSLTKSRYNRQLLIPSIGIHGQTLISQSKVLIIGLGGLGSPAALYLAGSGVHTLGLLDHDVVETSNLHRQIVHRESSVGSHAHGSLTKVASALRGCQDLNSEINYVPYETRLEGSNALQIIVKYDIVLDCTDNPATRYLINDCCVVLQRTLVSGAAQRLEGQLMILNYEISSNSANIFRGPCYRCVFPVPPSPDMVKGCSEIGILGPVVGAIGTLMASETLKLICQPGQSRKPTMLLYNAWSVDPRGLFRAIGLRGKRDDCVACGSDNVLLTKGRTKIDRNLIEQGSIDYQAFCGKVEDVKLLQECDRIDASSFLETIQTEDAPSGITVDVREPYEVELGPKLRDSINVPISKWHTLNTSAQFDLQGQLPTRILESSETPIYFVCQRGNDSQIAAMILKDIWKARCEASLTSNGSGPWIGDVKGGFNAIERLVATRDVMGNP